MTDLVRAPIPSVTSDLVYRRFLFGILVVTTVVLLLALAGSALAAGGIDALDIAILGLFAVTLPWMVIGFWNAMIGFAVMRLSGDPVAAVFPAVARIRDGQSITLRCAVLVCIRNEDPHHVLRNLAPLVAGLAANAAAKQFQLYVLSDSDEPEIIASEESAFSAFAARWRDKIAVRYRRRIDNTGFKAGNIRDFCERWGGEHDVAITLDADSLMPAAAVLRLVRLMQLEPRLGIVQALVVGLPATSAFARVFQFGMRFGMLSYTIGSAWWQGDCGPYWGHNAILRLAPFIKACQLPPLPNGKAVLSHDQIEAVLMRRASYEVRALPEEDLGWEENPPTLVEFIRRDLRWCQGNMQYWRFLVMPGLKFVSRCQLAIAILMFLGSPAWVGLMVSGTLLALRPSGMRIDTRAGRILLVLALFMWFAPKIATAIDVLLHGPRRLAYGGVLRLLASLLIETIFFILLSPIQWVSHTIELVRLALGASIRWNTQARHTHGVTLSQAFVRFWPHTILGLACLVPLALANPAALPVMLLVAGGPALAIPLAGMSSSPGIGKMLVKYGLCGLPEECAPPDVLREIDVPALALRADA